MANQKRPETTYNGSTMGSVFKRVIDWGDGNYGDHVGVTPVGVTGTASQGLPVKLVDETGAVYGVKQVNGKVRVSSMPYLYDIAEGNVTGHTGWSKIGYNGDVGTSEEDIWTVGGTYVWPAAQAAMKIASSSANDTAGSVNARTVRVYYLNAAGSAKSEAVTINGTHPVTTVATDLYRINALRLETAGTNNGPAGTITLKNTALSTTFSQIVVGYSRARNITYTVPVAKALYITSTTFSVYGATKGIRFTTRATYDSDAGAARTFFLPYFEVSMTNGALYRPLELPAKFPAGTRIKVSGIADAAGAVCSVALRGWLEDA
jgi:hypothetical protein